ncbi:MAG TPA: anthranilate synthase component I family protein, partial [Pyrinomonadaceae bacterium]|nr:anthranilate synthase component I family protein [Pyrinomonadaceae bacterium]
VNVTAPEFLSQHFQQRKIAAVKELPLLAGGAVGYLGYQATKWFEPAFTATNDDGRDDAVWMLFKTVMVMDRVSKTLQIVSVVFTEEAHSDRAALRQLYEDAVGKISSCECALNNSTRRIRKTIKPIAATQPFTSNWQQASFEAAVNEVKEHIRAGDCYQVVISQSFQRNTAAEPLAIYRALRQTNPSPFMFFLRLGDRVIAGASPEMLVRCRGRELQYRPIAGTLPRGNNDKDDDRLAEELRHDEKEVAEHAMLVDLGRNDLGRIAEYGSVMVEDLMSVERYSHVQHLVTRLSARLREGLDRFDALAACFPAGTVTGAPKVKAMEIIRRLEPNPRDVYSGAIVYADYAGALDSCIAIRMLTLDKNGRATVQAGAGIVADSVPSLEYEETINKAQALFHAIELAEEEERTAGAKS